MKIVGITKEISRFNNCEFYKELKSDNFVTLGLPMKINMKKLNEI